ncbi:MAG: isoprenyl transferase [Eubacteriales bacterium]|nr:isoprenyl transferase [Eubacteriales bacterium]
MKVNKKLNHLAIIMDGNGRWAIKRGKPRLYGHKAGIESFKRVIKACGELGIGVLSVFAFSTENWTRPQEEVDGIMNLVTEFCEQDLDNLITNGVKVVTMGDLSKLPQRLQDSVNYVIEKTKNNNKLILNIGINYGARAEILRAVNNIIKDGIKECDEQTFNSYLYTANLPDPDLIIRASGEKRLSNFMLYQCAYSEFYFPKVHWPDFNKKVIEKAIKVYQKRNRRFGGLKNN